ncbi:Nucleotidylyl transferase [Dichomitus squalens LYAD-421 SS1]|uniref:Nucleotidylyl transferase n=1 Tax=Dichomitus squalens (strain LYAD-421) TaxID=732165 RepID=UPI0004411EB5|nr:Nucleotidylyl transferase [Dichomitus squalens LYAD-421 SS1]EJF66098.1 Nucleotidylyl transferase [Dichomitus squalens LYAD-421 SS1]
MPAIAFTLEEVKRTVVLTTVHDLHESPHFLATAVVTAATTTTEALQVIVLSPLFNPPPDAPPATTESDSAPAPARLEAHDDWHAPGISRTAHFEDVQRLLTFVYVQATKIAQDLDRVLLDVDVYLKGPADAFPDEAVRSAERIFSGVCLSFQRTGAHPCGDRRAETGICRAVAPNGIPFPPLPASAADRKSEIIVVEPDDLPSGLSAPAPSSPPDPSLPPLYPVVALGGTFDHLHAGHKILLSMGAWIAKEKLIVGITDDSLLGKKQWKEVLEPLPVRTERTRAFLEHFKPGLEYFITPLNDVYGPTAHDPNVQALVVSKETLSGAESIAKKREEMSLQPLRPFVIDVISATEAIVDSGDAAVLRAAKMSSTYIREWIVKKQQHTSDAS